MFKWLFKLLKRSKEADKVEVEVDKLKEENNAIIDKLSINPLEEQFNNKYPKQPIFYKKSVFGKDILVDIRQFINYHNTELPKVMGETDDEKAFYGLMWMIKNIKYITDKDQFGMNEYWDDSWEVVKNLKADCEGGAFLLYDILRSNEVPAWKLRLSAGYVKLNDQKVGHAYLTYYFEEKDKWVTLDWCFKVNSLLIFERKEYKDEEYYLDTWFSWNELYSWAKDTKDLKKSKGLFYNENKINI